MARPEKVAKVAEVREHFDGAAATLLTHYRGLSVTQMAQLRAKLREANAEMHIVKNTLARRAADDAGIDGFADLLNGPTALVFCAEDPVGPAKAIKAFQKDVPELIIRGSYMDGELLDDDQTTKLADLDSREELLAKLAGLMDGALANTARLLQAATEKQARLLQALVDAGGAEAKGFGSSTPAEVVEASAPAEAAPSEDAEATSGGQATAGDEKPADADAPAADASDDTDTSGADASDDTDAAGADASDDDSA